MSNKINKTFELFKRLTKKILEPSPILNLSDWADNYRKLSSEASAEPGQWRTSRAPYQKEIMNAVSDSETEKVVVMASAQVGKTEFILNTAGYFIDYDPSPIMIVQPTVEIAKDFSKNRFTPMIRDTEVLRNKISDSKSRDSGNTVLNKSFPGGYVVFVGANAPSGLASKPIRILLADEIDRWPLSAGTEGDPLSLAEKRTNNFYNRKKLFVSTPTIKGASRIEKEYEGGTQEEYALECPSCEEPQSLQWGQIHFNKTNLSEPILHCCKYCGSLHNEYQWKEQKGKWVAKTPNAEYRSFRLNEFISPWKKWREIVFDFLEANRKGKEALKVWTNTSLGETWEEDSEQLDNSELAQRTEEYPAQVPDEVNILTAAVDTQDDRFEIEVKGWSSDKSCYGIEYHRIYGDLNQTKIWNELDEYLKRKFTKQDGRSYEIVQTFMDSGGHYTQEVYKFTKPRIGRRIYAIKGASTRNNEYTPVIAGQKKTNFNKCILVTIGVNECKSKIHSALLLEKDSPGSFHFPKGHGYNEDYFLGLTAEKLVKKFEKGHAFFSWQKVRERNEPLDLSVYNLAAYEHLNPNPDKDFGSNNTETVKKVKRKKSGVLSNGVKI